MWTEAYDPLEMDPEFSDMDSLDWDTVGACVIGEGSQEEEVPAGTDEPAQDMSKEQRKKEKARKQNIRDAELTRLYCADFDTQKSLQSRAWALLTTFYGKTRIPMAEIRPLADVMSRCLGIFFPREVQRRRLPLLKWCEEHIEPFEDFLLNHVQVCYENGDVIDGSQMKQM